MATTITSPAENSSQETQAPFGLDEPQIDGLTDQEKIVRLQSLGGRLQQVVTVKAIVVESIDREITKQRARYVKHDPPTLREIFGFQPSKKQAANQALANEIRMKVETLQKQRRSVTTQMNKESALLMEGIGALKGPWIVDAARAMDTGRNERIERGELMTTAQKQQSISSLQFEDNLAVSKEKERLLSERGEISGKLESAQERYDANRPLIDSQLASAQGELEGTLSDIAEELAPLEAEFRREEQEFAALEAEFLAIQAEFRTKQAAFNDQKDVIASAERESKDAYRTKVNVIERGAVAEIEPLMSKIAQIDACVSLIERIVAEKEKTAAILSEICI